MGTSMRTYTNENASVVQTLFDLFTLSVTGDTGFTDGVEVAKGAPDCGGRDMGGDRCDVWGLGDDVVCEWSAVV